MAQDSTAQSSMSGTLLSTGVATMPAIGASSLPAMGAGTMPAIGANTTPATGVGTELVFGSGSPPGASDGTAQGGGGGFILYPAAPAVVHPYATISIKSHIPMTLTMKTSSYSKWASFFKSMCGKFSLKSHIDGTAAPRPDDPDWDQANCCVRSWIFSSVDDSVLDLTTDDDEQTT